MSAPTEKPPPELVCWRCGHTLKEVPRPITRMSRCIPCRADLHVCRLCIHYDRTVLGECRHERADRILDKELANFCTHFRPRPDAFADDGRRSRDTIPDELESLFGSTSETSTDTATANDAAARLKALFGDDPADR